VRPLPGGGLWLRGGASQESWRQRPEQREGHLVQLEHVHGHAEGVFPRVAVDDAEQLRHAARREPRIALVAVDGEGLAAARLAVRKDAHLWPHHAVRAWNQGCRIFPCGLPSQPTQAPGSKPELAAEELQRAEPHTRAAEASWWSQGPAAEDGRAVWSAQVQRAGSLAALTLYPSTADCTRCLVSSNTWSWLVPGWKTCRGRTGSEPEHRRRATRQPPHSRAKAPCFAPRAPRLRGRSSCGAAHRVEVVLARLLLVPPRMRHRELVGHEQRRHLL
jgi:hypothetical protein